MPYKDTERQKQAQRESVRRHRERANATIQRRRAFLREYIDSKKNAPCADCGGSWPTRVMDFHHVCGPKLFRLAEMANMRRTLEEIDAEIAKCLLLCANCHRMRHP